MVITTRKQRERLLEVYRRHEIKIMMGRWSRPMSYREFRKTVHPTFGCDNAVTVQWAGMWLCIETDGYCHS